jgi:hypothetical protein
MTFGQRQKINMHTHCVLSYRLTIASIVIAIIFEDISNRVLV